MAKRVGVDKWLFGVVLLLMLFGLVMVFSASAVMAQASLGSPYPYVMKQAKWGLLGLIAMVDADAGGLSPIQQSQGRVSCGGGDDVDADRRVCDEGLA